MGGIVQLQIPFGLDGPLGIWGVHDIDPQEHAVVTLRYPNGIGHILVGIYGDLPFQTGTVALLPIPVVYAAGPLLLIGDGVGLPVVVHLTLSCSQILIAGACPLIGEVELTGVPVVEAVLLSEDGKRQGGAAGIAHANLSRIGVADRIGHIPFPVRLTHHDIRLGKSASGGEHLQSRISYHSSQRHILVGAGLHQGKAVERPERGIVRCLRLEDLRSLRRRRLSRARSEGKPHCRTADDHCPSQDGCHHFHRDACGGRTCSRTSGTRPCGNTSCRTACCRRFGGSRSTGCGGRCSAPRLGQHPASHGRSGGSVQNGALRLTPQEVEQQQNGADAVELHTLALVILHPGLDALPGVVQAAFHGALAGFHGLGDLPHAHLIVIVKQHTHPLLRRQSIHQVQDHPPGLLVIQRLLWHQGLVQVLHAVQQGTALLIFRNLPLLVGRRKQVTAAVCRNAVDPPPESCRFFQPVQARQHDDQHVLGSILGGLFLLQHLLAVVIDLILYRQHQGLLGLPVPLNAFLDQIFQFLLVHLPVVPFSPDKKWSASRHTPPPPEEGSGGGTEKM